jgi:hypothetical protein
VANGQSEWGSARLWTTAIEAPGPGSDCRGANARFGKICCVDSRIVGEKNNYELEERTRSDVRSCTFNILGERENLDGKAANGQRLETVDCVLTTETAFSQS